MSPVMTFRIAFKALGRNKLRTALTMLGMIIGVSAVITLVAMGNGATSVIEDQIKGAGTNMITVNSGNFTQGGARGGSGTAQTLTVDDADAIRNEVAGVQYLAPGVQNRYQVVAGNQNWFTRIQGTDVDLPLIRAWPTRIGSFFSSQDVSSAAKVAWTRAAARSPRAVSATVNDRRSAGFSRRRTSLPRSRRSSTPVSVDGRCPVAAASSPTVRGLPGRSWARTLMSAWRSPRSASSPARWSRTRCTAASRAAITERFVTVSDITITN